MKARAILALATAIAVGLPTIAHALPGAPDPGRVTAGTYKVDNNHTQVMFTVDHLGVTPLFGGFGASGGTLVIDPAKLSAATVTVSFNVAELSTTSSSFTKHMMTADLFDTAKHPTATFTSTSVQPSGGRAKIMGNLTVRGITRPVALDAKFFGAGMNGNSKKLNIGFTATTRIKRSEFGLGYGVGLVGDDVDLRIVGAFERVD